MSKISENTKGWMGKCSVENWSYNDWAEYLDSQRDVGTYI